MKKTVYEIGDTAICDLCGKDYTNSDAQGGLLFATNGVCPICAPGVEASAVKLGETKFIRDRALPGETFKQACLRWRGGNNTVTTYEDD